MKITKHKKIIGFILVLFFFLTLAPSSFCFSETDLEVDYPIIGGVPVPVSTKTLLPDYIEYIFSFALMIAGLVAFSALILGGYKHMTSGGNPAKMSDARDQITSAVIGLAILLSSFLILNTINPELTILRLDKIEMSGAIELYPEINLGGDHRIYGFDQSMHNLSDFNTLSVKINDSVSVEDIDVYFYTEIDYGGIERKFLDPIDPASGNPPRHHDDITALCGFAPKSIKIVNKREPGLYLCEETNYGKCKFFPKQPDLYNLYTENLNDKVKSIKFKDDLNSYLRVALHKNFHYEGECDIILDDDPDLTDNAVGYGASSMTFLDLNIQPYYDGRIKLCREHNCEKHNYCVGGIWTPLGCIGGTIVPNLATFTYYGFADTKFGDTFSLAGKAVAKGDANLQLHTWEEHGVLAPDPDDPIGDGLLTDSGISAAEISADGNYIAFLYKDSNYSGKCMVLRKGELKNFTYTMNDIGSSLIVVKVKY
ncbi:hypothetical protein KAR26_00725 [Candidatus Parcubacteria bacterium]|nr:hypothetical protein [Candidatus Parcubacteria bacterium]